MEIWLFKKRNMDRSIDLAVQHIDLLYFDNFLLKTPDLCNLRTFVAIFFVAISALFPPIFGGKKTESANSSTFRMYALQFILLANIFTIGKNLWQNMNTVRLSVGEGVKTLFWGVQKDMLMKFVWWRSLLGLNLFLSLTQRVTWLFTNHGSLNQSWWHTC